MRWCKPYPSSSNASSGRERGALEAGLYTTPRAEVAIGDGVVLRLDGLG